MFDKYNRQRIFQNFIIKGPYCKGHFKCRNDCAPVSICKENHDGPSGSKQLCKTISNFFCLDEILERKCKRFVFVASEEQSYINHCNLNHYYVASKQYYQHVDKNSNRDLPRKKIVDPWTSLVKLSNQSNLDNPVSFPDKPKKKILVDCQFHLIVNMCQLLMMNDLIESIDDS